MKWILLAAEGWEFPVSVASLTLAAAALRHGEDGERPVSARRPEPDVTLASALWQPAARLVPRLRTKMTRAWHVATHGLFDPYRPEQHYMRGPGPKWRAKHAMPAVAKRPVVN